MDPIVIISSIDTPTAAQKALSIPELLEPILQTIINDHHRWSSRSSELATICSVNSFWYAVTISLTWRSSKTLDLISVKDPERRRFYASFVQTLEEDCQVDEEFEYPPLPRLKKLVLSWSEYHSQILSEQIPSTLLELELRDCYVDADLLGQISERFPHIESLVVNYTEMNGVPIFRIVEFLESFKELRSLALKHEAYKFNMFELVRYVASREWKKLVYLPKITTDGTASMVRLGATFDKVEVLDVMMESAALRCFAEYMIKLVKLDLRIEESYPRSLVALSSLVNVQTLKLHFGGKGPVRLEEGVLTSLQEMPELVFLKIDREGNTAGKRIVDLPCRNRKEMIQYLSGFPKLRIWDLEEQYNERTAVYRVLYGRLRVGMMRFEAEYLLDVIENACPGYWSRHIDEEGRDVWSRAEEFGDARLEIGDRNGKEVAYLVYDHEEVYHSCEE